MFLDVFGATAKARKNIICLTNVPLNLESANNEKHRQKEGPIHLAFLHGLSFFESGQWGCVLLDFEGSPSLSFSDKINIKYENWRTGAVPDKT